MRTFNPIHNNILVLLDPPEVQSAHGIVIPILAQKKECWGTVVAAGDKAKEVAFSDRVFIDKYAGTAYDAGPGLSYVILPETKVLARTR